MAKRTRPNPAEFTVAELKSMLAAKTQIDELEAQRAGLMKELDKVEKDLAKLLSGAVSSRKPARKKAGKRGAKKAAKKAARKRAPKKVAKKAGRKKAAKKTAKKAPATGRPTIESVVLDLLTKKGEPMAFKDILGEIQKKKLIKSKAADFSNVLRRTLSTSERIKRVGRGVYGL
ncbi:MAG: HTH domain-containing protein [Candidatus Krumholzibacteriia bacterium]